ncbi:MAG: hypothetical protein AVDCRST_MAG14-2379, partial [uncultured Rubrobacteraceae bacterium]
WPRVERRVREDWRVCSRTCGRFRGRLRRRRFSPREGIWKQRHCRPGSTANDTPPCSRHSPASPVGPRGRTAAVGSRRRGYEPKKATSSWSASKETGRSPPRPSPTRGSASSSTTCETLARSSNRHPGTARPLAPRPAVPGKGSS